MKLKELNEAIAGACNVRAQVVTAVQAETFRQLRASLDKGEKVIIPEFGIFISKDVAAEDGQPAKKSCASGQRRMERQKATPIKSAKSAKGVKRKRKNLLKLSETAVFPIAISGRMRSWVGAVLRTQPSI